MGSSRRALVVSLGLLGACATGASPGDEGFSFGNQGDDGTSAATTNVSASVTLSTTIDPSATSSDPSAGTGDTGVDDEPTTLGPGDSGCMAGPEVCNGVDDDCNGEIDEADPELGMACDTGMSGVCSAGTQICDGANGLLCMPDARATAETCNGVDDDCDGNVDNDNPGGGGACSTGFPGVCSAGTEICTGGMLDCVPNQMAAASDTCGNGLDDDCDGATDEGCLDCYDFDLGNAVPQSVNGSNVGGGDSFAASCGLGGGADTLYRFTAPAAGSYTFDAIGSSYDTVITVYSDCAGSELGCNDDFPGNPDCGCCACSEVSVALAAGQGVIVAMEGYNGATGSFTLNIN
jgi:hypothetical protein